MANNKGLHRTDTEVSNLISGDFKSRGYGPCVKCLSYPFLVLVRAAFQLLLSSPLSSLTAKKTPKFSEKCTASKRYSFSYPVTVRKQNILKKKKNPTPFQISHDINMFSLIRSAYQNYSTIKIQPHVNMPSLLLSL